MNEKGIIKAYKNKLEVVTMNDVINSISPNDTHYDLEYIRDVAEFIEDELAEHTSNGECCSYPNVGKFYNNNFGIAGQKIMRQMIAGEITKEEAAELFDEARKGNYNYKDGDRLKVMFRKSNKALLKKLTTKHGSHYVDVFVLTHLNMRTYDYDEEFERMLDELEANE